LARRMTPDEIRLRLLTMTLLGMTQMQSGAAFLPSRPLLEQGDSGLERWPPPA
jgi:hypothetical protein